VVVKVNFVFNHTCFCFASKDKLIIILLKLSQISSDCPILHSLQGIIVDNLRHVLKTLLSQMRVSSIWIRN